MGKDYKKVSHFDWSNELWTSDKKLTGKMTRYNVEYLRVYKDLRSQMGRNISIMFFCITKLGLNNMRSMFKSGIKQKDHFTFMIFELKRRELPQYYVELFDFVTNKYQERINRMWLILKENIYLTEYYPFFEKCGYEVLGDFELDYETVANGGAVEKLKHIIDEFNKFKEENPSIIEEHLKTVAPVIEKYEKRKKDIAESEKQEKRLARELEKKERAFEKECESNHARYRKRMKQIDSTYYNNKVYR